MCAGGGGGVNIPWVSYCLEANTKLVGVGNGVFFIQPTSICLLPLQRNKNKNEATKWGTQNMT